jgi:predicted nucleic acid-binding protein
VIVLDSSFLIGFYNERDAHHSAARAWMERFLEGEWGRGVLLEYVFLEVVTVLLMRLNLTTATRVGQLLLDAEELDFVPCTDVFVETWQAFTSQPGTKLSFADAAIAWIAGKRAHGRVLTFDEEFRKLPGIEIPGIS